VSTDGSESRATRDIPRAQDQLFREGGGARAKYSALIVGRPGWGALLKYELVVLYSQMIPGALGLALRKTLYPLLEGPLTGEAFLRVLEFDVGSRDEVGDGARHEHFSRSGMDADALTDVH